MRIGFIGVSTSVLRALLEPIGETIDCPFCIAALQQRVQEVVHEWAAVKVRVCVHFGFYIYR